MVYKLIFKWGPKNVPQCQKMTGFTGMTFGPHTVGITRYTHTLKEKQGACQNVITVTYLPSF